MAYIPSFTQENRDALANALAGGVLRVSYADRTVYYQSTGDMLKALAYVDNALAAADPSAISRSTKVSFSDD